MKIGFDAKRAYHNYTGLGNYSRDLIKSLLESNSADEFFMYSPKSAKNPRFAFIEGKDNIHKRFPETPIHKTFKGFWRSINLEKFFEEKDDIQLKIISNSLKFISKNYYPPRAKKVLNLISRIKSQNKLKSTLSGCLILRHEKDLFITKEL